MKRPLLLIASLLALASPPAPAHKPSDAYLTIARDGTTLSGQWDIACAISELALGLDADGTARSPGARCEQARADLGLRHSPGCR